MVVVIWGGYKLVLFSSLKNILYINKKNDIKYKIAVNIFI